MLRSLKIATLEREYPRPILCLNLGAMQNLGPYPHITSLELSACTFRTFRPVYHILSLFPSLQRLNLQSVTGEGGVEECAPLNVPLDYLRLCDCWMGYILSVWAPIVSTLSLNYTSESDISLIGAYLRKLGSSLRCLHLVRLSVSPTGNVLVLTRCCLLSSWSSSIIQI